MIFELSVEFTISRPQLICRSLDQTSEKANDGLYCVVVEPEGSYDAVKIQKDVWGITSTSAELLYECPSVDILWLFCDEGVDPLYEYRHSSHILEDQLYKPLAGRARVLYFVIHEPAVILKDEIGVAELVMGEQEL
jgi:hypothetical protein